MKTIVITLMALLTASLSAAEKLDLKTITSGSLFPKMPAAVTPTGADTYAQLSADGKQVLTYSFKTGKPVGTLVDVDAIKGSKIDKIEGYILSPDGRRVLLQTKTKWIYRHSFTAEYHIYTLQTGRAVPLSEGGPQQTPLFSPDGLQIAFVRDNNIYLVKLLYGNAEVQVTKDGRRNEVINGIPDWVCEEEFAHNSAMVFTADSRQLLWVRYDETAVPQYSIPMYRGSHPAREQYATYPGSYTYKYPVAGSDNARLTLWSFDIKSRQTRQMQLPLDADGYIPRIEATADSSRVAVFTLNRHQDCLRIYMVNPLSTVSKMVIEDRTDKYVKEEAYRNAIITRNNILLPSERDGWMHLYLYNHNGQMLRRIDSGDYPVTDVYAYDEATGDAYFAANIEAPTDQRVYVVRRTGKRECLTPQAGWSTAIFSGNHQYFIHQWSDLNTPPVFTLCNAAGKQLATLEDNQALRKKMGAYALGTRELFTFTTSEGVTLNGWMVKPADFSPTKRYPVVMYQYGGPGSQQVRNDWSIGMSKQGAVMEHYLAQQGYLCVCIDNRGTGGRGADFEKCTYLRLGELEARDQVEAALWLGAQSYVDKNRIAIWGWSYGGWNTLMSMSEGRPVFRAGIAIAPPTSWRYYDTVYAERYMRTPKENPKGYDINPIARASQLHGALLLCHGLADDNVHYRNTAEYAEALVQADKDFLQLVYTNRNHNIYGGNTRNHLFRQCINFLNQEMK